MNTTSKFCIPLTVYYDKSCPLCATEMHALQEMDWRGRLRLVDCSAPGFAGEAEVSREDMLTRLHVRDPEGKWLKALDAFEAVYASAGLSSLARFWGSARLRPVLGRIYPLVARYRQPLSRFGLHHVVGIVLRRISRRARERLPG
jgi:predicted DCC family thiol-disulfide oxidoreductase YuxK